MMRRYKTLGVAVLALLAVGVVVAPGASGHKLSTSTGGNVDMTGTGTNFLTGIKSGALEVKCTSDSLSASNVPNGTEEAAFTPSYSGCTAAPFGASPIDTNGCFIRLHFNTTSSPNTSGGTKTDAPIDIVCPPGQSITETLPGCTIHIHSQNGLHGVTYDNEGPGGPTADIKVTFTVDNIHYTTGGGFVCGLGGLKATGTDLFLTGFDTVKGYTPGSAHGTGNHVGIAVL